MSTFVNIEIEDIRYFLLICLKKKLKLIFFVGVLIGALFSLLGFLIFIGNIFPWLKLLLHGVTANVFQIPL